MKTSLQAAQKFNASIGERFTDYAEHDRRLAKAMDARVLEELKAFLANGYDSDYLRRRIQELERG